MKSAVVAEVAGKTGMQSSVLVVAAAAVAVEAAVQEAHLVGTKDAAETMVTELPEVMHRSSLKGYLVMLRTVAAAFAVSVGDTALVEEAETGRRLQAPAMPPHSQMLVPLETFVTLMSHLSAVSDSGDVSCNISLIAKYLLSEARTAGYDDPDAIDVDIFGDAPDTEGRKGS